MSGLLNVSTVLQSLSIGIVENKFGLSHLKLYIQFQMPLILFFDLVIALAIQHLAITKRDLNK